MKNLIYMILCILVHFFNANFNKSADYYTKIEKQAYQLAAKG
jgi:hypothetical protein